jgi:hypothetical protein
MPKTDKWVQRWKVPRSSGGGDWTVAVDADGNWGCNCPRWIFTTPRKDCDHIRRVKEGEFTVEDVKKAEYRPAKVLKPRYDAPTNTLLVPLIALPDKYMMEATIVYYMLKHGYTMAEIRQMRRIPKEWTKLAVLEHIQVHGEAEYPKDWYPKPPGSAKPRKKTVKSRSKKAPSGLKGVR